MQTGFSHTCGDAGATDAPGSLSVANDFQGAPQEGAGARRRTLDPIPKVVVGLLILTVCMTAQDTTGWVELLPEGSLKGWEVIGNATWNVTKDGFLIGQSDPRRPFQRQSWLYTTRTFTEFDLQLEYWIRLGGNSGISLMDGTRARYAMDAEWDRNRTPARTAYEINIGNAFHGGYDVTGSIYLLAEAKAGIQRDLDWNTLDVEVRHATIRVRVNGEAVAEHVLLQDRARSGPLGLQLHDANTVIIFRNIRIREGYE